MKTLALTVTALLMCSMLSNIAFAQSDNTMMMKNGMASNDNGMMMSKHDKKMMKKQHKMMMKQNKMMSKQNMQDSSTMPNGNMR